MAEVAGSGREGGRSIFLFPPCLAGHSIPFPHSSLSQTGGGGAGESLTLKA